jgi:hypothetical protein
MLDDAHLESEYNVIEDVVTILLGFVIEQLDAAP